MTHRIKELWAFIARNEDGDGVVGFMHDGTMMPLICSDRIRYEQFVSVAQKISDSTGKVIDIAHFTTRESVGTITPK